MTDAPIMQIHTPKPAPAIVSRTYGHIYCHLRKTGKLYDAGPITVTFDRARGTVMRIVSDEAMRKCNFDTKTFRGVSAVKGL